PNTISTPYTTLFGAQHRGGGPVPERRGQAVGQRLAGRGAGGRPGFCAHDFFWGRCQPSIVACLGRETVSLPAGASRVSVVPAPRVAPLPTRTGATSWVSDPMKASSSMMVRCLLTPS